MFQQLRSHSLALQILLPFIAFVPYIIFLFTAELPQSIMHNAQGWIYHGWSEGVLSRPWLYMILGLLINLVMAYGLHWLNIRFEITGRRTVYMSYLFGLMILTPLVNHSFHPGMLGGLVLILSLIFVFLIYHSNQTQAFLFNAGLFWGLSVIIYPPFMAMLPIYILSARYVKTTRLKDFLLLFTGLLTPVIIWLSIAFLKGEFRFQWLSIIQWTEIRKTWPPEFSGNQLIWFLFLGYITLMLIFNIRLYRVKKDVGRRVLTILGQLIWICPLIYMVFERVSVEILWTAMVPISFLLSVAAFNSRSPWKSDLIFTGFFLFMLAFQLKLIF